ncbi:serine/threonine protein kinase [Streptomyces sp. ISL-98]|uniref:serine/threonine-protein kinase n=1 Tax=Streptomyces sp. ISL-98 TaxID=2819192 RepID=UPI001BE6E60F|nr:serine/threonine-protein kinase [Streptomyces sp. ISL-98]MBT2509826.1 serine/threonine protein kinase [Streptomyces sp. ISL-98]
MQPQPISGRYELTHEVPGGGMGRIWRGYDIVLDREVAVKRIRPDVITSVERSDELARRFRREARVTARIKHPGVPQVYDAVLDQSTEELYLVMEWVQGISLGAYIQPEKPLPVTWACAIAAQICTVLSHAHALPVVHRDLKPGNVMVAEDGTVKVLDFGIAAILRTGVTRITSTGNPVGTSQYMAPEQVQAAQATPQSDLYALGSVFHELLCGLPVFEGGSEFDLMHQQVYGTPAPLRQMRPDAPEPLERLTLALLEKKPEDRPAHAQEVYEALLPFLPLPGQQHPAEEGGPAHTPDPTMLYRRPYAPRPQPQPQTPAPAPTVLDLSAHPAPAAAQVLESMKAAIAQCDALLDEGRFAQAAEVLQDVTGAAAAGLGAENPRVLWIRKRRAAVLIVGGDFRRALSEFDSLAAAYARTAGPNSTDTLECRRQAAYCRAELGQSTAALSQFQDVLDQIRQADGDASPEALDLRRSIGMLLLAENRVPNALDVLQPLHEDLNLVYGPNHEDTQEIAEILARIKLAEG